MKSYCEMLYYFDIHAIRDVSEVFVRLSDHVVCGVIKKYDNQMRISLLIVPVLFVCTAATRTLKGPLAYGPHIVSQTFLSVNL